MNFRRVVFAALTVALVSPSVSFAKDKKKKGEEEGYVFTTIKENPVTSVKNQNRSSTCWSFSGLSFIESEILRNTGDTVDLAEMFVVSKSLSDKAEKYLRNYGHFNYGPGSGFGDVVTVIRENGIVPEEAMPGLNYGEKMHAHNELDAVTMAYLKALAGKPQGGKLTTAWKRGFEGILSAYLGERPETFTYKGKEYTPESFWASFGINLDDYVSLTSFTHHPFYTQFVVEVPDNWRYDYSYNLPLDEFMEVMENAINEGYTFAWASDVSEKGFTRNGLGVVPDVEFASSAGSDQEKWVGKTTEKKEAYGMDKPGVEKKITQELRQQEFDNQLTTDDHGMHIYGIAQDQNGKKYFMVKNSWGTDNKYKGTWYVSEAFVEYKTISILVHKDAIPAEIRAKLGI